MPLTRFLLGFLIVSGTVSCTSITRGSTEDYVVETNPSGASVRASTGWSCVTPCKVEINRNSAFILEIEKEGFKTERLMIRSQIDGYGELGMGGNILVGGLFGLAVDGATGSAHSHTDNPLIVELRVIDDSDSGNDLIGSE